MESLPQSLSALSIDQDSSGCFRFFDLPTELRRAILDMVFCLGKTLDLDIRAIRLLTLFLVSKQFHEEAVASFFGSNTFRLLPTHGRAAAKNAQPLIKMFPSYCRAHLVFLELRLGPFWTNPPRCWVIDDALGLEDAVLVRVLKVFIEVDPSHAVFNGFRSAKLEYTGFCGNLLSEAVKRLPNLRGIEIDGYPSVTRDLPLMNKMVEVALKNNIKFSWGPGQANQSTDISKRGSMNEGMVPFYSSPFHRYTNYTLGGPR